MFSDYIYIYSIFLVSFKFHLEEQDMMTLLDFLRGMGGHPLRRVKAELRMLR